MARTARVILGIVLMACSLYGSFVHASCVRFDAPELAMAGTVTDHPKVLLPSTEKLVTLSFEMSAFVQHSYQGQISQLVYVIEFPERNVKIVDYSPETSLYSDIQGNVKVTNQKEKASSLGFNASAKFDDLASANGNASNSNRRSENLQYERTPDKQWMFASGTMSRGSAVYFKIRPTNQSTVEGSRTFQLTLRVSKAWRGDYFKVRCAAYSKNASVEKPICTVNHFLVGVFAQDDLHAKQQVERLLEADYGLRQAATSFVRKPVGESNELKAAFYTLIRKKKKYVVPENWLTLVLDNRAASRTLTFEQHLPRSVREAIFHYRSQMEGLRSLATAKTTKNAKRKARLAI